MFGNILSWTIASQITGSRPVYSFSQEHGLSQAHVQFTDMQEHSEQEFLECGQDHTDQCEIDLKHVCKDMLNKLKTGSKNVCKGTRLTKRYWYVFQIQIHICICPPLLQPIPSDQQLTATKNAPAGGQTFLVQSMTELPKAQTQMLAAQAQTASVQSLPALTPFM